MKAAMGRLGWTPAVFWRATPREFWAALDGWLDAHVPRRAGGALSDAELATLEDMKRRFPDATRSRISMLGLTQPPGE